MFAVLRSAFRRSAAAAVVVAVLTACGGGHAASNLPATSLASGSGVSSASFPTATFTITIPGGTTPAANTRKPAYVSSATKSIAFTLVSSTALSPAQVTAYNATSFGTFNFTTTPPNATCVASGSNFTCSVTLKLPPGTDVITAILTDAANGTGNQLSRQTQTFAVTPGIANTFSITFDANAAALVLNGSGGCQSGTVGAAFGSSGTTPVTFTASYTDPDSKPIVGPGLPTITILGNDAAYHSDAGTIAGTNGTVAFAINQSTGTFTLTPSSANVTNAAVTLHAAPANSTGSSDGLNFNFAKSFTFSTGPAPPAHAFLAAVEQTAAASGKVDLFTMTVGAAGSSDAFTAYAPASLAVTNSTNEGKADVDNPETLAWDTGGDLLIGNADDGGVNHGNLACIPNGAIASGANTATTVSADVSSPIGLAYGATDGSVAIANDQPGATYNLSQYLLSGNYVAAPAAYDLKNNTANLGATAVADVSNVTGASTAYAVALSTGTETDPAHNSGTLGTSLVDIHSGSGVNTTISQTTTPTAFAIDEPAGLAFDGAHDQLVISNSSTWHRDLSFYTVSPAGSATQTDVINTGFRNFEVATSPDGHVAVAWNSEFGDQQVQVYDATAARNPVGGPIPYNAVTTNASCQSASPSYIYGNNTVIATSLTWLSNAKLLVAVEAPGSATNGLYVYDISRLAAPAGVDDNSCNPFNPAPTQTAFQPIANKPLATAYKP